MDVASLNKKASDGVGAAYTYVRVDVVRCSPAFHLRLQYYVSYLSKFSDQKICRLDIFSRTTST